ncbi:prenyltransferase/squalene oxidase repeat-containing protein [Rosistilla oblonga]|uniref:prenyltransferase/squalene oxidase repeat-containing protein n=1 Tax=Rosistilla oblonga TaxID=2527990 RepID=UPI003A97BDCD
MTNNLARTGVISRRDLIGRSIGLLTASALPAAAVAQTGDDGLYTPAVSLAIDRGLASLVARQIADGSFGDGRGTGLGRNVAVVSLAGLAMLSRGSLPDRGPHGAALDRCVDYIADACEDETGFIIRRESVSRGAMYGHGFATLFLAEVYGTSDRKDLQRKLNNAVDLIVRSQNSEGGWRYEPEPRDADLSVTICQMMALRAARNAGTFVPGETIERAVDYVRRCQNPDGGFMYQLTGGESRFPLTAGAIVALQNAGRYRGKELDDGYDFLSNRAGHNFSPQRNNYFFYAHYYSVQALWQRGGPDWKSWYEQLRDILLSAQLNDGSWLDYTDRTYATAMACIILNTPRSLLPIFQR